MNEVVRLMMIQDHMYTCDQRDDPCYEAEPREGETWNELAERKATHIVEMINR